MQYQKYFQYRSMCVMVTVPRLTMDQLRPDLSAALKPRVERLGYLGDFFRIAGHQPDALLAFNALTAALKDALPDDLTEVVALTVAVRLDNAYERNQHERLSVKLGFPRSWIARVEQLSPGDTSELTPLQSAAQRLALAAVDGAGKGSGASFEALVEMAGPQIAVAILMLVGRYMLHAVLVNTLELDPPVAGIFENASTGA